MITRYSMAFNIDSFFNTNFFNNSDSSNPYMLEVKSILGGRIICFDCLNEALDNIAAILQDYTTNQTQTKQTGTTTNSLITKASNNNQSNVNQSTSLVNTAQNYNQYSTNNTLNQNTNLNNKI